MYNQRIHNAIRDKYRHERDAQALAKVNSENAYLYQIMQALQVRAANNGKLIKRC